MGQIPEQVGRELSEAQRETWFEVLRELDFYGAKVLEAIYMEGCLSLPELLQALRKHGFTRRVIRKRLQWLEAWGLISLIPSYPLCVRPQVELEPVVKQLIRMALVRLGVRAYEQDVEVESEPGDPRG